uniref:Uncharacterized protein n=1 Tax=Noctiluca scintillans TaxID=2966 RepID=A0A7S1F038_NOCSC|mmetsp:Transcript_2256/g.6457  ORF Transcript_2256/g.6457 Transcript_2256/m.6457 type:complete len:287 (+) Transcript_2256:85-945(+)
MSVVHAALSVPPRVSEKRVVETAARKRTRSSSAQAQEKAKIPKATSLRLVNGSARTGRFSEQLEGRAPLPRGTIDLYSGLEQYRPPRAGGLEVYGSLLGSVSEDIRKRIELVLHAAWDFDVRARHAISNLLGLRLNGMSLRSGRTTSRCQKEGDVQQWLVWEQLSVDTVGALVLRHSVGRKSAMVIDYVAAVRGRGRGYPMLCAAEAICKREGYGVLYSAADLSQDGNDNSDEPSDSTAGPSAVEAHTRWNFVTITAAEWEDTGLKLYDEDRCSVVYMKKLLTQAS